MIERHGKVLYLSTQGAYCRLKDTNIQIVLEEASRPVNIPLHNVSQIILLGRVNVSTPLIAACAAQKITIHLISKYGTPIAEILPSSGKGGVRLRRKQIELANNKEESLKLAMNIIAGKIQSTDHLWKQYAKQYPTLRNERNFPNTAESLSKIQGVSGFDELLGIEGGVAKQHFSLINLMIKPNFAEMKGRTRRPPLDPFNACISLAYSIMASHCMGALSAAGLETDVGVLHTQRAGRASLALDMVEEHRIEIDRFVIGLLNQKILQEKHFRYQSTGACFLTDDGRKIFFTHYDTWRMKEVKVLSIQETARRVVVPFLQARLLAKYIRGDIDIYIPYVMEAS
jgi:CRISPR-associated protein Cas1